MLVAFVVVEEVGLVDRSPLLSADSVEIVSLVPDTSMGAEAVFCPTG
jgi:hypothetical protein